MTIQQKTLLAVLALLVPLWWFTLPDKEPLQSVRLPTPPLVIKRADGSHDPNAQRMPYIDTSRPECVALRDKILQDEASGSGPNIVYIGDCDVRYRPEESSQ